MGPSLRQGQWVKQLLAGYLESSLGYTTFVSPKKDDNKQSNIRVKTQCKRPQLCSFRGDKIELAKDTDLISTLVLL